MPLTIPEENHLKLYGDKLTEFLYPHDVRLIGVVEDYIQVTLDGVPYALYIGPHWGTDVIVRLAAQL